jgi:hypothetical protein
MRDLAPEIYRQRFLLEGFYTRDVDAGAVGDYLTGLAGHLGLGVYGQPMVHSPAGQGSDKNQGFDAFIPLVDSGICAYVWTSQRFLSVVIYSCKEFDTGEAVEFTREFFRIQGEITSRPF